MLHRVSRLKGHICNFVRNMSKRFKSSENNVLSAEMKIVNKERKGELDSNTLKYLPPPNKSESDFKDYSVIKLPNGLTALLISDKSQMLDIDEINKCSDSEESGSENDSTSSDSEESSIGQDYGDSESSNNTGNEEKLAACALCIGVGSFSDPDKIPGLAHFLEHMIFMGSEKYPKENEFDVFIKKKGGSDNASTECEYTTFYFDCHEAHLHGAMEIFSQLFISPIMKRDSMTKEREAIESEFQMALPSDDSRKSQLLCSLADQNNPAHKFLWGNLITLRDQIQDDDLYEAVHEFRKRHYSAHRMTLAVQARLPIELLEQWVVECFQNIPNNGLPSDEFPIMLFPFRQEEFSKIYIVDPIKDGNYLDLTWVLPSTLKMYKSKPLNFISWVLGHEGKGSLLSYLRRQLWSFDITVSSGGDGTEENSLYTLISISLHLTDKGLENISNILDSVFEYLNMFQSLGPQERLFKEMQLVAKNSFRFAEEVSSYENVEQLSENMHYYPSTDYITGAELYFEYDSELITTFLNALKPDNVNIMILSKQEASRECLSHTEKWFGTKYASKPIPQEWINNWKRGPTTQVFHLPEDNPFIASDFTILPVPNNPEAFPKPIIKNNLIELWYKQDATFKLPNAFCCINLISPLHNKTAQNTAMLDLFIAVLKQYLVEELYPANVAQLEYNFYSGEKGLVIVINGYNEKLKILLQHIIKGIMSVCENVSPSMVSIMKDEIKKSYYNSYIKPNFLVREIRMAILIETYWTALEKEVALDGITHEDMKEFISQMLSNLYIQCLVQGNLSKEAAIELSQLILDGITPAPAEKHTIPQVLVNQLPHGERYCIVRSFNEDANSVVTNYYQSGLGTIQESCIIELLLMLMDEPLFDSLRTKQQLGYDVSCTLRETFGVLGFSVSVFCQSDRHSVEHVESRITEFLATFLHTLKNTSEDDFKEVQESLIKLKKCADIHLKEEVKRNWAEIKNEEYIFDRHIKERELIEKLTLEDLINWFEKSVGIIETDQFKKLSTQVVGIKSETDDKCSYEKGKNSTKDLCFVPIQETSDKFILNISAFKNTLLLYPLHKITS